MAQYLKNRAGVNLAYEKIDGRAPGVFFCGGFRSDMTGSKAVYLENFCKASGQAYVRFDYSGHGASGGAFDDGSIGDWLSDALYIFDTLTAGPQVVVGSSMGGWIALLLARARPERLKGLIGLAAAPDFTKDIYAGQFTDKERAELKETGRVLVPESFNGPYSLTQKLFDDGAKQSLLHAPIPITAPVRLIHGKQDEVVPWQKSILTERQLLSADKKIIWVADGDHRLAREQDLALLGQAVTELSL